MKVTKNQVQNIILLLVIALLVFTPVGTGVKVYINRWLSFAPSVVSENKREIIEDYQWKLQTISGENYNFNETEGKVVLINFWATWCPPCIAEMPSLQDLYTDYKNDVLFLFVTNENSKSVSTFLDKHHYNFPVFTPLSPVPDKIKASSMPTTYLIDKKGKIIIDKTGAADWNSKKVRELLDRLIVE
ncbi:TlpA disulfide reductase family protein [Galbibacter sp. PAP.153]|uniref:TlpA family protein disulfide reductase n=1 Tax=Galbibacter sp. PAP.153 TaxID=3104623 RepID=UPI00300A4DD7